MLSKLSFRNARRSFKDNIIYLITVTLSFSFIFALLLVSNSKAILQLCSVMENFRIMIYFINVFIVLVIGFLINYTTKFIFQKRSKEFGTYLLLGIKRKKIAKMFTLENLILGFLSFLLSIPLGFILSLLMTFLIMNIFEVPYQGKISFSFISILINFVYFCLIYLVVLFLAKRRIKKMKIDDLLYLESKNEKKPRIKVNRPILFFFSLLFGITGLVLFDRQFSGNGDTITLGLIFLCLVLIIFSIYGVLYTATEFLLGFVLQNKKRKYRKDHLFLVRTFSSKIRTMSITIGTLAMLITLTLISLNVSSLFKAMFNYQIDATAPYDITIRDDKEKFLTYQQHIEKEYTITDSLIYNIYQNSANNVRNIIEEKMQGWQSYDQVFSFSDYNKLREMKGEKPVSLEEGKYLLHATRELADILENDSRLTYITLSNGAVLKLDQFLTEGYIYSWGLGSGYILVVPDSVVAGLKVMDSSYIVNTKEKTTERLATELTKISSPDLCQKTEEGYDICTPVANITVRGKEEAFNNGTITITSFIFFYIAFLFTAVVGTILAIQALSDASKYKYRYQVLSKLGVSDLNLYKTIGKQLLLFFLFPLFYPIVVSFCTIASMNRMFKIILVTDTTYIMYFFTNLILFLAIYGVYFLATYFGFKKTIKE